MILTPAIKGQLTKAVNSANEVSGFTSGQHASTVHRMVMRVFAKHMPREQAKHAARKYLASIA